MTPGRDAARPYRTTLDATLRLGSGQAPRVPTERRWTRPFDSAQGRLRASLPDGPGRDAARPYRTTLERNTPFFTIPGLTNTSLLCKYMAGTEHGV